MTLPKAGLLGLYLRLYDEVQPEIRSRMDGFYREVAAALEHEGLTVMTHQLCREQGEFDEAVNEFERAQVDAVITLHLAYSPSLEAAPALTRTDLPVIVLDTTPTFSFGPDQSPQEILFNHGIHGVQDLCNLLVRKGKRFCIEVGHWRESDVLSRVAERARAARAADRLRRSRVGLIGEPFRGMGDFAVPPRRLRRDIGIHVVHFDSRSLPQYMAEVSGRDVEREREENARLFDGTGVDAAAYTRTLRTCLGVRRWIDAERLDAFSFNFQHVNQATGFETVPFLLATKLMGDGVGYAGEGDVLTAGMVAALLELSQDVSFTEMFCPDWKNEAVFVSHMGEMSYRVIDETARLVEMPYRFGDAANPVVAVGRFRAGPAHVVNLAPVADGEYRLLIAPVQMLQVQGSDSMSNSVHGWFRPEISVSDFLARYSYLGGTHHVAVIYNAPLSLLQSFGAVMGFQVETIG
jgi:L-arabinose isomerase